MRDTIFEPYNIEVAVSMGLEELTDEIRDWVGTVLPGIDLNVTAADETDRGPGISLMFVGFRQSNDARHTMARRDPVIDQLEVDCLIVPHNSDPLMQSAMVSDLYFAALDESPGVLASSDAANAVLNELSLGPGSGLLLTAKLSRERKARRVELVQEAVFDVLDKASSADAT
jgi:hypothetical protein